MKKHLRFVYGILSVFMFELVTCPATGQGLIPKTLTPDDYKLWSSLQSVHISDQGKWIHYTLRYESRRDTLFVKNVDGHSKYAFPKGASAKFSAEKIFACLDNRKNLNVLDLKTGKIFLIPNVSSYEFMADGQYMVCMEQSPDNTSTLCIRDMHGELAGSEGNVTEYKINRAGDDLWYVASAADCSRIGRIHFGRKASFYSIQENLPARVQNLTVSADGSVMAFYGLGDAWQLYYYQCSTQKLSVLNQLPPSGFESQLIAPDGGYRLKLSDDNSAVFFSYKSSREPVHETPLVEVWNAADKVLYLQDQLAGTVAQPYLAVWYPGAQKTIRVSSQEFSWAALNGSQKFAIIANPKQYEPQYLHFPEVDYFIMDVTSGSKELLVKKVSSHPSAIGTSPDGRLINYYKNHNWWIYDIAAKTHTNITKGLTAEWDNSPIDPNPQLYGFAGWGMDGKTSLIYDQFDLWQVSADGKIRSRLTRGKEQKIRYRLVDLDTDGKSSFNYSGLQKSSYDTKRSHVLSAENLLNAASGYCILDHGKVKPLVYKDRKISSLAKARKNEAYLFIEQSFRDPPSIVLKSSPQAPFRALVKTNSQQQHFLWGFSEMIHYCGPKNMTLNGALFYPAGYNAALQYPMVVYIYSTTSNQLHEYVNPTGRNNFGFNISTLTSSGYFVLLADIAYVEGNPGISALHCVTSAVSSVTEKGLVDPHKIGILGHSFGAYETNFIITQSSLFAAAVSGAGVADIIRTYFSISGENQNPEIWRYESQQYRMGRSFYQAKKSYYANSPILHADRINTPLLTWAGKLDVNVNTEQSTALYLALRRLGKAHIMLQYPGQGHILTSPQAQEDLSRKTLEWLDYHLKKNSPAEWITSSR